MKKYLLVGILALGCGGGETAAPQAERDPAGYFDGIKIGLGVVDGLPGTPVELSANGVPLIDGIERPDYLPEGINSWDKRATRVTDDNPTGEMRWNWEGDDFPSGALDMPEAAGFNNGQDRYNYCLVHECSAPQGTAIGTHGAAWQSDMFYGTAFSGGTTTPIMKGACWTAENSGLDCEFPNTKNWTWGFLQDDGGVGGGPCAVSANHHGSLPFFTAPILFAQKGFDLWGSAATSTPVAAIIPSIGVPLSNGRENFTVHCPQQLPGSMFGAVMARSGPFGALTKTTANVEDLITQRYGPCAPTLTIGNVGSFYQYSAGDMQFDAGNMYDRATLCSANNTDQKMLQFIATNTFAHERGHLLGFFHFSSGLMQSAVNCSAAFNAFRATTPAFTQALNDYVGGGNSFKFPGSSDACQVPVPTHDTPLPIPKADSTGSFFGKFEE